MWSVILEGLPYYLALFATIRLYNDWKSRSFPYLAVVSLALLVYFQGYRSIRAGFCPIGYPGRKISEITGNIEPRLLSWECSGNFVMLCLDIFLCVDEMAAMHRSYQMRKEMSVK